MRRGAEFREHWPIDHLGVDGRVKRTRGTWDRPESQDATVLHDTTPGVLVGAEAGQRVTRWALGGPTRWVSDWQRQNAA